MMEENKKINDSELEKVTGGGRGPEGYYCDICGAVGGVETYEIKIHLQNPKGIMYLGRKDVCYTCRDTHLADYIAKNGLGPVDGVDMKGC